MRKKLAVLLVLTLLISLVPVSTFASGSQSTSSHFKLISPPTKVEGKLPAPDYDLAREVFAKFPFSNTSSNNLDALGSVGTGTVKVMVELNQAPIMRYQVDTKAGAEAVQRYEASLLESHKAFEANLANLKLGATLRRNYTRVFNGYSLEIPASKLSDLKKIPGVKAVYPVQEYKALDDMSNPWIGADQAWAAGYTGKGLKVAVIDTGIDYNHPDLKDNYLGGFDFVDWDENPMETISPDPNLATTHGTHVAGIIAGTGKVKIKGVAPEAKILAYRVLGPGGSGTTENVVLGIERAVQDGANVLNLSLGNILNVPDWPTSIALDNAARAGVIPVVAAGNSGPGLWTVGSPGTSRMAITVGASTVPGESITINKVVYGAPEASPVAKGTRMGGSPPFDGLTSSYEMVYVGLGTTADFAGKDLRGKVALIKRGSITFAAKANNAKAAGAVAAVIFNNVSGDLSGTLGAGDFIPTMGISDTAGQALLNELTSATQPVLFSFTVNPADTTLADKIASFSSRGPVSSGGTGYAPPGYELGYQLKPDVLAPGVNILSSVPNNGYAAYSGTSMATPHVAGAALLLKQAHPNWSVQDIKAALMNTAKDLGQPAVAQGAGRIDIMAGIGARVLLEPESNVPTGSLNFVFKSLADPGQSLTQTYVLKVRNVGTATENVNLTASAPTGITLTFDQPQLTLSAGAEARLAVTATIDSTVGKNVYEGLVLANLTGGTSLRVPVGIFVVPDMIQNFALTPSYVSPNFDNVNDYQTISWRNTQVLSQLQLVLYRWGDPGTGTSQWLPFGTLLDIRQGDPDFGYLLLPAAWKLSWSPEGLPDGMYALQIVATSVDGQVFFTDADPTTTGSEPTPFFVDVTPPQLVSANLPGEGSVLNEASLTLAVNVFDMLLDRGVSLSFSINGTSAGSYKATNSGPYNFSGTLVSGNNTLVLKAVDAAGNVSYLQSTVKYDPNGAKLILNEPRFAENVVQDVTTSVYGLTVPGNKVFVQLNDGREQEVPVDAITGNFGTTLSLLSSAKNRILVRAVDGVDASKVSFADRTVYSVNPWQTVMVPHGLDKDGNSLPLNLLSVLQDPYAWPQSLLSNVEYLTLPPGPARFVGARTGIGESYLLYKEAELLPNKVNHVVFDGGVSANTLKINASWGGIGSPDIRIQGGWLLPLGGNAWRGGTFFELGQTDQNGSHVLHMTPGNERWQPAFSISGQLGGLPIPGVLGFFYQGPAEINLNETTFGATVEVKGIDGAQRSAKAYAGFVNPLFPGREGFASDRMRFPTGESRFDWGGIHVDVTDQYGGHTASIGFRSARVVNLNPGDNASLTFGGPISGSIRILDVTTLTSLTLDQQLKESLRSFLRAEANITKLSVPEVTDSMLDLRKVAQQTNTLALPGQTVKIVPLFSTQMGDFIQWAFDLGRELRPKITITDKDANVLVPPTEFSLWQGFDWTLPQTDSGPYFVTVSWDLGFYQPNPIILKTAIRTGTLGLNGTVVSLPGPKGRPFNFLGPVPIQGVIGTGFEFDLPVRIDNALDLFGAQVQVKFDPAIFEVVDANSDASDGIQVKDGDLLQATPGLTELLTVENAADNTAGTVKYSVSLKPAPGNTNLIEGVTGSGNLAFIRLRAKAPGRGTIQVSSVKLADSHANEIIVQVKDYQIEVRPGAIIKGRVQLQGRENPTDPTQPRKWDNSHVRIWLAGSDFVTNTHADGDFQLTGVPIEFSYDVYAEADPTQLPAYFLDSRAGVMVLADTNVDLTLLGGDAKPDGFIDIFDVVTVAAAFDTKPGDTRWNKAGDINGDGTIDIADLVLPLKNFNKSGRH